jgi:hypothetical protein
MQTSKIIDTNLNINSSFDEMGRQYFHVQVAFSDEDRITVYRNSIEELLDELPQILASALRARIIIEQSIC